MGCKLSSSGGLTYSQKQGLDKNGQAALLKKLSSMEINKPILKKVAEAKSKRDEAAKQRREERTKEAAQNNSSTDSKSSKKPNSK